MTFEFTLLNHSLILLNQVFYNERMTHSVTAQGLW